MREAYIESSRIQVRESAHFKTPPQYCDGKKALYKAISQSREGNCGHL